MFIIVVIVAMIIVTFFLVFNHSNFSNSCIESRDSYTIIFVPVVVVTVVAVVTM